MARPQNARRLGSKRGPVGSTIRTPEHHAETLSRDQRRALSGPVRFHTAVTSRVRDAYATPVQVRQTRSATGRPLKRVAPHIKPDGLTTNLGGSTPIPYLGGR